MSFHETAKDDNNKQKKKEITVLKMEITKSELRRILFALSRMMSVSGSEDACRLSHRQFLQAVESMRSAGYRRVSWRIYEGMRHEILNETGRETVYCEAAEFFGARLEGESEA